MSTKGGPVFTFILPGGVRSLASPSIMPLYSAFISLMHRKLEFVQCVY